MFPLWLLPLIGAGVGAATNLNHPDQMVKNMGIGAGVGALGMGAGMAAPSLLGNAPQAIQLGASMAPQYSLSGASQMPAMSASLAGLPSIAGNPALMGLNPALTSASGGTVANSGLPLESLMKIAKFAGNPQGQQQQPQQAVAQAPSSHRPQVQLLKKILDEEEMRKRRRMPGFSGSLFSLLGGT